MRQWGVIFDLDGTMVDNRAFHEQAWIDTCRQHGKYIDSKFYFDNIHARTNDVIIRHIFGAEVSEVHAGIGRQKELNYRELYRPHVKEIPGLTCFLKKLSAMGVKCAVASNSPMGNVDLVLNGLKVRQYFSAVICADDVTHGKPDPEIFLVAAKKLGLEAGRCLIFEDSPAGFKAAQNAGCKYIVIKAGGFEASWQNAGPAAAIYDDFTNIEPEAISQLLG